MHMGHLYSVLPVAWNSGLCMANLPLLHCLECMKGLPISRKSVCCRDDGLRFVAATKGASLQTVLEAHDWARPLYRAVGLKQSICIMISEREAGNCQGVMALQNANGHLTYSRWRGRHATLGEHLHCLFDMCRLGSQRCRHVVCILASMLYSGKCSLCNTLLCAMRKIWTYRLLIYGHTSLWFRV